MYVAYTSQAETMTHMCEIVYGSFEKEEQEFEYDMQEAENGGGGANGEGNAEGEANGQGTTTTQETSTNGTSYDAEERAFLLHLRRLLKGVSKKVYHYITGECALSKSIFVNVMSRHHDTLYVIEMHWEPVMLTYG